MRHPSHSTPSNERPWSNKRARWLPARVVERARIVLRAAEGWQDKAIAAGLGIQPKEVARWRERFLKGGLAALQKDAPRPGRPRTISESRVKEIIERTTQQTPSNATQWSTRTMAAVAGVSEASVRRIWRAHGLKPHLAQTFKVSNDPEFAAKLENIVGLYLNPPEHALVLCVDEKSQIQALDRTQPGLPLKPGRCGTMTHDYRRNRTATLFAALDVLDGTVISMCDDRHRHQEWLKFQRVIDCAYRKCRTARDHVACVSSFNSSVRRSAPFTCWPPPLRRHSNPEPHSSWRTSRCGTNSASCIVQ